MPLGKLHQTSPLLFPNVRALSEGVRSKVSTKHKEGRNSGPMGYLYLVIRNVLLTPMLVVRQSSEEMGAREKIG